MSDTKPKHTPGPVYWDGDPWNESPEYREQNAPWLINEYGHPVLQGDIVATEENAQRLKLCWNAHDALVEAARYVKRYLDKLEGDTEFGDPLREMRRKMHAPLHAKLDAALLAAGGKP